MDKERLWRCLELQREIDALRNARRRALDRYAAPPEIGKLRSGSEPVDRIGAVAALREEYQRQIDLKLIDLADNLIEIETAITPLPSEDRRLIRLRYIEGLPWERIARELTCGQRQVLRRHGEILQRLAEKD